MSLSYIGGGYILVFQVIGISSASLKRLVVRKLFYKRKVFCRCVIMISINY
jgi:hypothetical protein